MNTPTPSPDLIEATVADLRGVISRLEEECADIESRLVELRSRCRDWEKFLAATAQDGQRRTRARKGENDRKIVQLFQELPGQGFTLPELATTTGISWSSVRNVVRKNGSGTYEERDGKWYRKTEQP